MNRKNAVVPLAAVAASLLVARPSQAAQKLSLSSLSRTSFAWSRPLEAQPFCPAWERLGFCALQAEGARSALAMAAPLGLKIVPVQVSLPAVVRLAQAFIDNLKVGEIGSWRLRLELKLR